MLTNHYFANEISLPWPKLGSTLITQRITSKYRINKEFDRVCRGVYIPHGYTRDPDEITFGVQQCPRNLRHRHHMITRIRAHALAHPNTIFAGWSALRMLGLPFWTNDMSLQILGNRKATRSRSPAQPDVFNYSGELILPSRYTLRNEFYYLPAETQCVDQHLALTQALMDIRSKYTRWKIPDVVTLTALTKLSAEHIYAIQLLDTARQYIGFSDEDVRIYSRHRINSRFLDRILRLSRKGADSPPETLIRLIAATVFPNLELQHQFFWESGTRAGKLLTIADLFSPERGVAIFYDGRHHDGRDQRNHDYRVDRELQSRGIHVLRFSARDLHDVASIYSVLLRYA